MPMPMQISLEEVISMLLSRVESLALNDENNKTKFNIVMRVLYRKGLLSEEDVLDSVKEEHRMLKELGLIHEDPGDDVARAVAENVLQWIRGDVDAIKRSMDEYEKKMQEYAREHERKSSLTVAPSGVLQQLDKLASSQGAAKSKLII